MLVYQLDAKLKRGFDFLRGNLPAFNGLRASVVQAQQSIRVRLCNPLSSLAARRSAGADRVDHGERPKRALSQSSTA